MSAASDKISLRAMDCQDHVECWQEYHEEGLIVRLMLSEEDVEGLISISQAVLAQMVDLRERKGYPRHG